MTIRYSARWIAILLLGTGAMVDARQQPLPTLPVPPLGNGPFVFDTAEAGKIKVTVVARGLAHPWSLVFLPDGRLLVTERPGRLRVIRHGALDPAPIAGVPTPRTDGNGGLMDIALHPKFAENKLVYLSYTKPLDEKRRTVGIARARFDGKALTDFGRRGALDRQVAQVEVGGLRGDAEDAGDAARLALIERVEQRGGLAVDSRAALLVGGDSGPALEPGKPAESLLIDAVKRTGLEMPPAGKGEPLTAAEIDVLERWIRAGAPAPETATASGPRKRRPGAFTPRNQ